MTQATRPHLLFVCSRNLRRSLTAEQLLRRVQTCAVRSVGTASCARVRVTAEDVLWADVIYAMEYEHVEQLRDRFRDELRGCELVCLDIPDDYELMDPALVETFDAALAEYLGAQ